MKKDEVRLNVLYQNRNDRESYVIPVGIVGDIVYVNFQDEVGNITTDLMSVASFTKEYRKQEDRHFLVVFKYKCNGSLFTANQPFTTSDGSYVNRNDVCKIIKSKHKGITGDIVITNIIEMSGDDCEDFWR